MAFQDGLVYLTLAFILMAFIAGICITVFLRVTIDMIKEPKDQNQAILIITLSLFFLWVFPEMSNQYFGRYVSFDFLGGISVLIPAGLFSCALIIPSQVLRHYLTSEQRYLGLVISAAVVSLLVAVIGFGGGYLVQPLMDIWHLYETNISFHPFIVSLGIYVLDNLVSALFQFFAIMGFSALIFGVIIGVKKMTYP